MGGVLGGATEMAETGVIGSARMQAKVSVQLLLVNLPEERSAPGRGHIPPNAGGKRIVIKVREGKGVAGRSNHRPLL